MKFVHMSGHKAYAETYHNSQQENGAVKDDLREDVGMSCDKDHPGDK